MLGNPIYNGRQVWNRTAWVKDPITGRRLRTMRPKLEWVIIESPELTIIDDELWKICEARTIARKRDTAGRRETGKNSGGRNPKYLFSGLLKCGVCGGAFSLRGSRYYGCSTYLNRGQSVCSNSLSVKKDTIERVLLAGVKESLLSNEAFKAFETEARALLKQMKPDSGQAKRKLEGARKELDNLMTAIKEGIITPTTKAAVQTAEQTIADTMEEIKAVERFEPTQMLPRAREIYNDLVTRLEMVEDVAAAREALRGLIGDVMLVPEGGKLTAEIQSAGLAGALYETLVAGAGFEPTTFGL